MHGRIDKLFLAHTQVYDKDGIPYFDWAEMNNLGIEIINTHRVKGLKSKRYPVERIARKFNLNYFSDTLAYMVAYALDQNTVIRKGKLKLKQPLRLKLYGCDMMEKGEYGLEKGGIETWLIYARCLGAEIVIPKESFLFRNYTGVNYGEREPKQDRIKEFMATSSDTGVIFGELDLSTWSI